MPDLAQFGIIVPPVQGKEEAKKAIREIGDEGDRANKRIQDGFGRTGSVIRTAGRDAQSSSTGFNGMAAAMTRNAGGAGMLLRMLGPLGGESGMLAERLERAALAAEHMVGVADHLTTRGQVLSRAFQEGQIGAATMAAAQERLTADRIAAATAEAAYAKALAASKVQQEEMRAVQAAIREQKVLVSDTTGARQVTEQRVLNDLQRTYVIESNAARATNAELASAKQRLTEANHQLAESEKIVGQAQNASVAGMGGTVAIIAGVVVTLIALGIAIAAVKRGWDLLKDSVAEGGKLEAAKIQLEQVMGNAQNAGSMLQQIESLRATSGGRFTTDELTDSATKIRLVGNAVQDVMPLVTGFAELASRTTSGSVSSITQIYDRAIQSIADTGQIGARELKTFTTQGVNLEALLQKAGIGLDSVRTKTGGFKLTYDQLNAAFIGAGQNIDAMEKKAAGFSGLIGTISTLWEQVKARFGEPVAIALEPILRQIRDMMPQLARDAEEVGRRVANLVEAFGSIARSDGWKAAIKAAWQVLMDEVGQIIDSALSSAFSSAASAAGDSFKITGDHFATGYNEAIKNNENKFNAAMSGLASMFILDFTDSGMKSGAGFVDAATTQLNADKAKLQAALNAVFAPVGQTQIPAAMRFMGRPPEAVTPDKQSFSTPFDKGAMKDFEEYANDIAIINDYWYKYSQIQATAATATERTRRVMELQDETAKQLRDPSQYADVIGKWRAMENERVLAAKIADERIKSGEASLLEGMARGFQKLKEEWGNWAQAGEKAIIDIGNSLATNISSGLTDIITGTKTVSQGFRDMAVAILRSISEIIIKMLVLKALESAFSAFGGGSGISAGGAHAGATVGAGWSFVRNVDPLMFVGAPRLHSGLMSDEYPAILQRGEQVIPRGGAGGGTVNQISVTVHNNGAGGIRTDSKTTGTEGARELGRFLQEKMDEWGHKQLRSGGLFSPSRK